MFTYLRAPKICLHIPVSKFQFCLQKYLFFSESTLYSQAYRKVLHLSRKALSKYRYPSLLIFAEFFVWRTMLLSHSLYKIPKFHLIFWCGNFAEMGSFCRISGDCENSAFLQNLHARILG